MSNLTIITAKEFDKIETILSDLNAEGFHVTNGTYAAPEDKLLGTTLSGFQYLVDTQASLKDVFMFAVNSNKSMADFSSSQSFEDELIRADKVAGPLSDQHLDRQIMVVFYNEQTPTALYNHLAKADGVRLKSLHKWGGYGIGKNAPIIEGADLFEKTFAFPFANNDKPVYFDHTTKADQSGIVQVVDLHHTQGKHGDVYLDSDNKPLFKIK